MKLRLLAVVTGLAMAAGVAQAQTQTKQDIGIYLTPMAARISNSTPDSTVFAFLGPNATSAFFEGFGVGVYDDLLHASRFDVGLDARASLLRGGGAQLNSFLVGARVSFKPVSLPFKPYFEVNGGVGGTKAAHNPLYVSQPQYGGQVGIDYPLGRLVDFRVVEVGYSSVQTVSSGTVNSGTPLPPSSGLITFGTGIVFRIPSK
jgi:hypothetical protein